MARLKFDVAKSVLSGGGGAIVACTLSALWYPAQVRLQVPSTKYFTTSWKRELEMYFVYQLLLRAWSRRSIWPLRLHGQHSHRTHVNERRALQGASCKVPDAPRMLLQSIEALGVSSRLLYNSVRACRCNSPCFATAPTNSIIYLHLHVVSSASVRIGSFLGSIMICRYVLYCSSNSSKNLTCVTPK